MLFSVTRCHAVFCHPLSCCFLSHVVLLFSVTRCHAVFCHTSSCCFLSHVVMLFSVTRRHVVFCHTLSCCFLSPVVMLFSVTRCHAVFCQTSSCCFLSLVVILTQYTNLRRRYKDGRLTDVIVEAEERQFKVHSVVLACHSQFFRQRLVSETASPPQRITCETCVSATALKSILDYLYTGS